MDLSRMLLVFCIHVSIKVTWTKESKFCRSHFIGPPNYCGTRNAACGPGYVINVVEVEKGDMSSCTFCNCCDETRFNEEWTNLMKEYCDGKRNCDTSRVNDVKQRAVKTVYECIPEYLSTTSSANNMSATQIEHLTSTSGSIFLSSAESNGTSPSPTDSEIQQNSSATSSIDPQQKFTNLDKGNTPHVVVTIAIPIIAVVVISIVVVVVIMYRKHKLNEHCRDRANQEACDNSLTTGHVETQYEDLERDSKMYANQPEHVYTVTDPRENVPEHDHYYSLPKF